MHHIFFQDLHHRCDHHVVPTGEAEPRCVLGRVSLKVWTCLEWMMNGWWMDDEWMMNGWYLTFFVQMGFSAWYHGRGLTRVRLNPPQRLGAKWIPPWSSWKGRCKNYRYRWWHGSWEGTDLFAHDQSVPTFRWQEWISFPFVQWPCGGWYGNEQIPVDCRYHSLGMNIIYSPTILMFTRVGWVLTHPHVERP